MPAMGVYRPDQSAFQDIVAPEIQALRGAIQCRDGRIAELDAKVDGMKAELLAEIPRLDPRIGLAPARSHIAIDVPPSQPGASV
jgi:hypothetical protein